MKLRYHGEHRGDHTPWIYTTHVSVETASHQGRAAWRRSYRFEQISPASDAPSTMEGSIVLDRATLAPIELQSTFGKVRQHWRFLADRVEATDTGDDGKVSQTRVPLQGPVVTDVWAGLDLHVLGLPLREGFQDRIHILYEAKPPRPFRLSVERIEAVRVPAGELESFRLLVTPLDGDDRMRSIYHVRTAAPRVVVRKEYVVNPRTEGPLKRSTAVEELEAIELSPDAEAAPRSAIHRGDSRSRSLPPGPGA
jgi:hypothetical protein